MQSITPEESGMKVGNEIIDNQHKVLFDLIKDFKNAILSGSSSKIKDALLGVLFDYFFQHFRTEEGYLNNNADYMRHCLEHYELIKNLNIFIIDLRSNRTAGKRNPADFLENWLIEHIKNLDQPYFSVQPASLGLKNKSPKIDEFESDSTDRRQHKRILHNEVTDGKIRTDCYNATHLKNGKGTIVNMSPGGLLLSCPGLHEINDLLILNCSIGNTFRMKEKVKVVTANDHIYGVEFISPSQETINFLTTLYGAVHLNRAKTKRPKF